MVASYSSSLLWRVVYLLVQGLSASAIARLLNVRLAFVKKNQKIYRNTSTVDYPARTEANHQMLAGVFIRGSRINEIGGN